MTKKRMSKTEAANNAIEVWAWAKLAAALAYAVEQKATVPLEAATLSSQIRKEWESGIENKFRALAQYVMNK